jgi:electron transfer flavoprotein alpha subunit
METGRGEGDIWVFAEQREGALHEVGLELLGKARELNEGGRAQVVAVLLGHGVGHLVPALHAHGADRVLWGDDPELALYRLMPFASALEMACQEDCPRILLFGATALGMELAPRLAARLGTGLSAHCIDLRLAEDGNLLQVVPGWGGGVLATIKCPGHRPQMATVMPGALRRPEPVAREGEVKRLDVAGRLDLSGPRVLEVRKEERTGVPLEGAEVVVAGGWGIGGPEGWRLLEELAQELGGAVGATRPPVDEGWAREEQMIGQSGRTIRPRLYVGVGISGMMHHVVGMDDSGHVIAINTDPRAALLEAADLAVVGDYREIVPALIAEIRRRRAGGKEA